MPVPVPLNLVVPDEPDFVALHIYEALDEVTPLDEIEIVAVDYPNYPTLYTTAFATAENYWFAVRWKDDKGAFTDYSLRVQGGTFSVLADIVDRIQRRDGTVDEEVAFQEAEAVLEEIYGTTAPDPATVTKRKMSGMVALTMARIYYFRLLTTSSSVTQFTAGLVSVKTGDVEKTRSNIKELMVYAESKLGLSASRIAYAAMPEIAGGAAVVAADLSRLIIEMDA